MLVLDCLLSLLCAGAVMRCMGAYSAYSACMQGFCTASSSVGVGVSGLAGCLRGCAGVRDDRIVLYGFVALWLRLGGVIGLMFFRGFLLECRVCFANLVLCCWCPVLDVFKLGARMCVSPA